MPELVKGVLVLRVWTTSLLQCLERLLGVYRGTYWQGEARCFAFLDGGGL